LLGLFVLLEAKQVPTPFGWRPEQCVHRNVPSGSIVEEVSDGMLITYPTGEKIHHPIIQECLDSHAEFLKHKQNRTKNVGQPLDGWLDYAGYYPPNEVVSFTGYYLVPPNPSSNSGQVLFYFIGTENFQTSGTLTILQPVLTWGNGLNGWSIASWNCCPSGMQTESTPFQGFGAGDTLYGSIQASGGNWVVISSWPASGQSTTLSVPSANRDFDWIDVTLETYTVTSCNQFPNGPMVFSDMVFTDQSGQTSPVWTDDTGPTECGGNLVINSPSQITITHS
jgi:hypothetical protein